MKLFQIPDYTNDDLKQAFSPEEWAEIMEHLGYKLNENEKMTKEGRLFERHFRQNRRTY